VVASDVKRKGRVDVPAAVDALMNKAQVAAALVISIRKLEQMVSAGDFPRPFPLPGSEMPRWTSSTVNEWIARARGG
jgi:predicted DNA-binding transcriptional regulator AlpA